MKLEFDFAVQKPPIFLHFTLSIRFQQRAFVSSHVNLLLSWLSFCQHFFGHFNNYFLFGSKRKSKLKTLNARNSQVGNKKKIVIGTLWNNWSEGKKTQIELKRIHHRFNCIVIYYLNEIHGNVMDSECGIISKEQSRIKLLPKYRFFYWIDGFMDYNISFG